MENKLRQETNEIAQGLALLAMPPDDPISLDMQRQGEIIRKLTADLGGPSFDKAKIFIIENAEHVGGVIERPISLLQWQFKLGYSAACILAAALERLAFWEIYYEGRTRMARIPHLFGKAESPSTSTC